MQQKKPKGKPDPFFIGWAKKPPKLLQGFLFFVSAVLVGGAAGVAFSIGASVPDPGNGTFLWSAGYQTMTGVVEAKPYPVLRLPPSEPGGEPRALLLSGVGKRGVQGLAGPLNGKQVDAGGVLLKRGTIEMLQVGGQVKLRAAETPLNSFEPQPAEDLGRWRLSGEVCDGKCYVGAMRPGVGLAHKACANLCLIGGVPPVFVSTSPVDGSSFFLLADAQGNPVPEDLYDLTALFISLEGEIERRDDLLIFKADLTTAKRL
ncbi:hypothetical protein [Pseudovibrio sp. SPO723]|uniref:hypothetical protein n=1 Tax=Nesiotobacter zosterae TaxID=392721 RepID=UPI0029C35353|nr:hypothetical protein [Pseudovibrio sp. SPO723]MDX5592409.1 hypothetical protein [Pseudovibrio sp. SPO723]